MYVDLDALDRLVGVVRPDATDDAAIAEWARLVDEQPMLKVLVRGAPVDLGTSVQEELGFGLIDVRQSVSHLGLLADSVSLIRLGVPVETVLETARAQPVWGPRYGSQAWEGVEFIDSSSGEDIPVTDVVNRTDTRPLGYADQLAVGTDDVLISTVATQTMRDVIDRSGGALGDQQFVRDALAVAGESEVVQALLASLHADLWGPGRTLVALHVRAPGGDASSIVVLGSPGTAEAEEVTAHLEGLAAGTLEQVFGSASIETVGATTVVRSSDPAAWLSIGEELRRVHPDVGMSDG